MKNGLMMFLIAAPATVLIGCSGTDSSGGSGASGMSSQDRAARNLCETMRSKEPTYRGDCAEPPYRCRGCGVLYPS